MMPARDAPNLPKELSARFQSVPATGELAPGAGSALPAPLLSQKPLSLDELGGVSVTPLKARCASYEAESRPSTPRSAPGARLPSPQPLTPASSPLTSL